MGRPRSEAAVSHAAIMDAVYGLLKEKPARDLTMDAVAKRAGVGKPTLYKWWPSKAALTMAMFHERFNAILEVPEATTAEEALRTRVKHLIAQCNGLFGKVVADLIAEGQGDPSILKELYESHIRPRRASTVADIERGIASGEFQTRNFYSMRLLRRCISGFCSVTPHDGELREATDRSSAPRHPNP
jgi:AcrR family transcriptional regulator